MCYFIVFFKVVGALLVRNLRDESGFKVDEVVGKLKPSEALKAAALLSHAVRESAASEFRALITYDSSSSDMPSSRDSVFIGSSMT